MPETLLPSPETFDLGPVDEILKSGLGISAQVDLICKSLMAPPGVFSYGQLNTLPDPGAEGFMSWPGLPPETLRKMVASMIAPKVIVNSRVTDVQAYSQLTNTPARKGWAIEMLNPRAKPTKEILRQIREAEQFILNCNAELTTDPRKRDYAQFNAFDTFLAKITRDSFTYDGIAIWTDVDVQGRLKAFAALPAGHIRLCGKDGYKNDPAVFAVLVDEAGKINKTLTRDELTWAVTNPRTEPDIGPYGWPHLDQASMLVDAFENAVKLNAQTFTESGIPQGMLLLKGVGWSQKELDFITRMWNNLKKGISKFWSLPAISLPNKESDIELLDLSAAAGKDALYQEHMNLVMGLYCTICQFPVRRLGFRISGKVAEPSIEPNPGDKTGTLVHENDIGLTTFLQFLEGIINPYILWTRYPHLRFVFRAKTPKEDAREYENRQLAKTLGERRAECDLEPLEKIYPDHKEIAGIMSMAPIDPGLGGVYQSLASVYLQSKLGVGKFGAEPGGVGGPGGPSKPGARFPGAKDPAKKEGHGGTSGVRRSATAAKSSLELLTE